MPEMNGFYVKELKKCYRACKQNQDFYSFLNKNANKLGYSKTMPLEPSKDNNALDKLPKGEIPLVLNIGKFDFRSCDNILNTELHSEVIKLCEIPKEFNSSGGIY